MPLLNPFILVSLGFCRLSSDFRIAAATTVDVVFRLQKVVPRRERNRRRVRAAPSLTRGGGGGVAH